MRVEEAKVGARGFDSYPFSTAKTVASYQAKKLSLAGLEFFVGYLGAVDAPKLKAMLASGLAFMPVTFAGAYNGAQTVAQCEALGIPAGCTVWLDLEGTQDPMVADKINAWADTVKAAGYEPGLYVGSPQPFTDHELYKLHVVRYWKAPSRIVDRNGAWGSGPDCGFCCLQLWPSLTWRDTGVLLDVDVIQQDHLGRLPHWVVY